MNHMSWRLWPLWPRYFDPNINPTFAEVTSFSICCAHLAPEGKNCKISALQQNCYVVWNIFFAVMAPKKNVHANKDMKGYALLDIFYAPSWHVPIKHRIDWQACRRCQKQLCKRSFIECLKGRSLRNKNFKDIGLQAHYILPVWLMSKTYHNQRHTWYRCVRAG